MRILGVITSPVTSIPLAGRDAVRDSYHFWKNQAFLTGSESSGWRKRTNVMYYSNKIETLKDIFDSKKLEVAEGRLIVDGSVYPIVDDVIILLESSRYPDTLKKRMQITAGKTNRMPLEFAEDIQFTFGEEWQRFPKILPEHEQEFLQYFNLIDLSGLADSRVCDLGCGIGRWSYFLKDKCRELVLVDFSESIFVARRNLKDAKNSLFFMGDLRRLPFRDNFSDILFCLGVLHHLPTNSLDEIRTLKKYAPVLLVYLYYALDNKPIHFHILLFITTALRKAVARIRNPILRSSFTWVATILIYLPLIWLGKLSHPFGLSQFIPLYDAYNKKSIARINQDVYDRFFTRIEQRFSKKQILALRDSFNEVTVSDKLPYWHFVCKK
ncbi:MAG: class I SAM-dependent methyltransferase [Planctomycetes bacterium]|nr:class I SAM-dependent methyltransferase [Planctomycetota bacterium]